MNQQGDEGHWGYLLVDQAARWEMSNRILYTQEIIQGYDEKDDSSLCCKCATRRGCPRLCGFGFEVDFDLETVGGAAAFSRMALAVRMEFSSSSGEAIRNFCT